MEQNLVFVNLEQYHKIWRSFVLVPRCSQSGLKTVGPAPNKKIKQIAWTVFVNIPDTDFGGEKHGAESGA